MIGDKIEETQVTRSINSDYLDIMSMLKKYEDKKQVIQAEPEHQELGVEEVKYENTGGLTLESQLAGDSQSGADPSKN
jgi:hypothetical protein